jgi:hypothetical protein
MGASPTLERSRRQHRTPLQIPAGRANPQRRKARAPRRRRRQFNGAPGAFSFVVEGAITDADANYTAQGAPITAADGNNLVSRKLDISEQIAFIRVKFTALANNVNVAATITPD